MGGATRRQIPESRMRAGTEGRNELGSPPSPVPYVLAGQQQRRFGDAAACRLIRVWHGEALYLSNRMLVSMMVGEEHNADATEEGALRWSRVHVC